MFVWLVFGFMYFLFYFVLFYCCCCCLFVCLFVCCCFSWGWIWCLIYARILNRRSYCLWTYFITTRDSLHCTDRPILSQQAVIPERKQLQSLSQLISPVALVLLKNLSLNVFQTASIVFIALTYLIALVSFVHFSIFVAQL